MSCSFQLRAVVEAPYLQEELVYPWDLQTPEPLSWIRLSGEITDQEIGLFFAKLVQYNQLDFSGESHTVLDRILNAESLILPGGLQATFEHQSIAPSCCCGLEDWREWQGFLTTGESPWLGHDPMPWVEAKNGQISIWSDSDLGESIQQAFQIEVSRSAFRQALQNVEQDLQNFLYCIDSWAQTIGFNPSKHLAQKISECFDIGNSYTELPM
jgi:hypothetical protein